MNKQLFSGTRIIALGMGAFFICYIDYLVADRYYDDRINACSELDQFDPCGRGVGTTLILSMIHTLTRGSDSVLYNGASIR
jgi:hypothetical protein